MDENQVLKFTAPVIRVNNREFNVNFFVKNIGMRLVSEENALAMLSSIESTETKFIVEESPATRTRFAEDGQKKLERLVIKSAYPEDVAFLIMHKTPVHHLFKGKKGWAFEAISPEKDRILVHAEDDIADLQEVPVSDFVVDNPLPEDFAGLRDFTVSEISLNVLDVQKSQDFYHRLFPSGIPVHLEFHEAQGVDLACDPHETWDIEILEFQVDDSADLAQWKEAFIEQGLTAYLDASQKVLVIDDPSQIEIWFCKSC